jgi:hypothetical protein
MSDEKVLKTDELSAGERAPKRPVLRSQDLPAPQKVQTLPKSGGFLQSRELSPGGKLKESDLGFISRTAGPEDLRALRAALEERLAQRPRPPFYFVCSKCGWTGKLMRLIEDGSPCLACNRRQERDGGRLTRLTDKKKIAAFEEGIRKAVNETVKKGKKFQKSANMAWQARIVNGEFGR